MSSRKLILAAALVATTIFVGCHDDSDSGGGTPPVTPEPNEPTQPPAEVVGFSATVHRTEGGFPHIFANDFGSLGFGTGYAGAESNFCILAENVLRLRGQLSEYLGPDDGNLDADLFRAYMAASGMYDADVRPEMEYLYEGFAAGFNHYLRETGVNNIPDSACRGATWVQEMSAADVKRAELTPAFLPRLAPLFIAATPPAGVVRAKTSEPGPERSVRKLPVVADPVPAAISEEQSLQLATLITDMATAKDKGSNGTAIGRDLTDHSGALLYTNPHVDWGLTFHFMPRHLVIPGVTNLLGSNTYERAFVGFGTNGDVAWTNTVSPSRTQSLYELELAPGNPLAYMFDGEVIDLKQTEVTVNVLDAEGSLSEHSHTFYESRHGLLMGSLFAWNNENAFAMRIADEGNRGQNGQMIALARAKTVHDVLAASNTYQASANLTTVAADSNGEVLYGDLGPVVNLTDEQLVDCASDTPVLISFFAPAFRGDVSDCEWQTNPDSAADGLLGASQHPWVIRSDYVSNSNGSYWLVHPDHPISGIPEVMGDTETERTLRTRSSFQMIQERIDGTDGLGGNTFNLDSLVDRMLSNQHHVGQLLRDDLVTLCEANPSVDLDGESVDISTACPVLAAWDLAANLDSRGAHLFREFIRAANGGSVSRRTLPADLNYTMPFDLADPVRTPRGLDISDNPVALTALAEAVQTLNNAGIALDARLGDIQTITKNDQVIPMHGGEESEGVYNKMSLEPAGAEGYPAVTGSSGSWIMAVEFAESGLKARGILTYSISSSSESPNYADMSEKFSRRELVDLPYTIDDVEAQAISSIELSQGTQNCSAGGWQDFQQPGFADEDACRQYFVDIEAAQLLDWAD